jgi:hypothetical protein
VVDCHHLETALCERECEHACAAAYVENCAARKFAC